MVRICNLCSRFYLDFAQKLCSWYFRRQRYEKRFRAYPDVLTINEFRDMLDGIGDDYARKLLRKDPVEHFYIRGTYYIQKVKVGDYMLSPHYLLILNRFQRNKR